MKIRRYRPSDLEEVNKLWEKHHSQSFSLPPLAPSIIDCIVEDDDGKIIAFGNLKVYAECVMVMDHDKSPIRRARAFSEIMPVAIMGAQRAGVAEIHATVQDTDFGDVLRKHFGFRDVLGEHLVKEV